MSEQILFDLLKSMLYPDLVKSEGVFDSFDCSSVDGKAYIELKCRRTHYDTLLIEEKKYMKLMQQSKARDLNPYYINSTPEGVFSFALASLREPEWVTHRMPVTTDFANRVKVDKRVGYIHIEEATKI